jgi:hypothetical protein
MEKQFVSHAIRNLQNLGGLHGIGFANFNSLAAGLFAFENCYEGH